MRTPINKIMSFAFLLFSLTAVMAYAAPSRIDCLERLGNGATKEQLDSCVSGKLPARVFHF